ncbi:hypothetical protein C1645_859642 [Glomus cerebriforme]|uniref:Phosphatidylglycerol/phosphatidylinositol transfer protein n=1 Tax=Glomus cerebriforme TaxID=658196 RepID=A0A397SEZ5_9GLOM|nr:hypothetical protein C1645_859642 [Glomus cerebriforme]
MNRTFIFAFILLTTLSIVNAIPLQKNSTVFLPCPIKPAPDLLSVTIKPDPPVAGKSESFTISGKLHKDINVLTVLAIVFGDASLPPKPLQLPFISLVCGIEGKPKCPIKAGTSFTVTADSVSVPSHLTSPYTIGVAIGIPTGNPKSPFDAFGCTFAIVGKPKATGLSPNSYPIDDLFNNTFVEYPNAFQ